MDLDGKVAIVTGASRGVGAATAVALAQAGCAVACAARSTADQPQKTPGTLDETVAAIEELGGEALAVPTNLADPDDVTRMVTRANDYFGRVDILINNAAITFVGDLHIPMKRHQLVMAVNFDAPFIATRAVAPIMEANGGGAIINVSSVAALYPHDALMSYGVSKIALERLTVDCAKQLAPANIAVNCFRIDVPVASEGFVANTPGVDRSDWEPCAVAAEGVVWMVRQPAASYTGRRESMYHLRLREGIMASCAQRQYAGAPPPQELFDGLAATVDAGFREPYV